MIKVFISCPVTGVPDYADRFKNAEQKLTEAGYYVINPAVIPGFVKFEDAVIAELSLIRNADWVVRLPYDGKENIGCEIEYLFALRTGKPCLTLEEALKINRRRT